MKAFFSLVGLALACTLQAQTNLADDPDFRTADGKLVAKMIDPELRALVISSKNGLKAGKTKVSDLVGYLQGFEDLLAKHQGEKTKAVAQILYAEENFLSGVLDDRATGAKLLRQLATDYPDTELAKSLGKPLTGNGQARKASAGPATGSPWLVAKNSEYKLSLVRSFVLKKGCELMPLENSGQTNLMIALSDGTSPHDPEDGSIFPRLSADGSRIVVRANEKKLQLLEAMTCQPVGAPLQHPAKVSECQISPDSQLLATTAEDGLMRFWQMKDGRPLNDPIKCDELLMEMFFSADSSRLCGITSNSLATVWDVRTGRKVGKPFKTCEESWREFHSGSGAWTVFSPDGRTLLDGRGPYWLWDVETGTRRTNSIDHNDKIFAMVFSPDSKRVVTTAGADERCARVWDAQTGKPLTKPLHHHFSVFTAKFLPDGRRFVTTCLDNEARIWDSTNGKLLAVFANPEAEEPLAAFSPDGQYLFTSGGKVARIWSTTTGQMLVKPIEFSAEVKAATFGADSKSLQTVTETRLVQIWDFRN